MIQQSSLKLFRQKLEANKCLTTPAAHVVLGSGFGAALSGLSASSWKALCDINFGDVPGLTPSTVMDHAGAFRVYRHEKSGKTVVFQMGRIHGYEGHTAQAVVQTVLLTRFLGCENYILTNAAGGLDKKMKPGEVMVISDQINLTGMNPLYGPNPLNPEGKEFGPRFPDMGDVYSKKWRDGLKKILKDKKIKFHEGVYLGLLGPSFETHAEVKLFSSWGAKSVGMSTVWEAIALKHSGARVAGLSMISNLGAGLSKQALVHDDIVKTCRGSASKIINAVSLFLEKEVL